jgi:hypothetical protein
LQLGDVLRHVIGCQCGNPADGDFRHAVVVEVGVAVVGGLNTYQFSFRLYLS